MAKLGEVVITVKGGLARIGRWQRNVDGQYYLQYADNERELEHTAAQEVRSQGGVLTEDGGYYTPSRSIINRARFNRKG